MMPPQGRLSIEQMCHLARVSRASFYRSLEEHHPVEADMELRAMIQQIVLEHRHRYGYRRVTQELHRWGRPVNHKRVGRLMREDNLLGIQPRAFAITTDSRHDLQVRLNLARWLHLTGVNQLWVADITYIRLHREFVFLAVILDAFSRKVVGWALDRHLKGELAVNALRQALSERQPRPGLVHHSDRGVQYACAEYVKLLREHQVVASMSRAGNPYDNASCESFMKTLKQEEIYANQYEDLEDLREHLQEFIENYYNRKRLHSALAYQSPEEFEQRAASAVAAEEVKVASLTVYTYAEDAATATART